MIPGCTFYVLQMHLCNSFKNLRLLVGPNGHLSTKPKLATFLVQGASVFYCSALLYQNVCLWRFWGYSCILLRSYKY